VWTVNVAEMGWLLSRLFSSGTLAGAGLDFALVQIAAKQLRLTFQSFRGFVVAGNVFFRNIGGIRPRSPRFSPLSHDLSF
jgi:hypothetical protein